MYTVVNTYLRKFCTRTNIFVFYYFLNESLIDTVNDTVIYV